MLKQLTQLKPNPTGDPFFFLETVSSGSLFHIPSVNKSRLRCSLCQTLRCFDVWRWKCSEIKYSSFGRLNYVCVHCQIGSGCSCEGCTFLPLAQNTLPPYYRDAPMQAYGNIKWRGCTPHWTQWISMSASVSHDVKDGRIVFFFIWLIGWCAVVLRTPQNIQYLCWLQSFTEETYEDMVKV